MNLTSPGVITKPAMGLGQTPGNKFVDQMGHPDRNKSCSLNLFERIIENRFQSTGAVTSAGSPKPRLISLTVVALCRDPCRSGHETHGASRLGPYKAPLVN